MDMLQVNGKLITDKSGNPVRLRGFGVGGWMNTENFINGYPGCEVLLRETCDEILGKDISEYLFDRMLDYFLAEKDIAFMKKICGASVVRLPLNYRHFESDAKPFRYIEKGFERLDNILEQCRKHGLYAILDMHAVQGFQDPDWHSDNPYRGTLIWRHPHFQERFISLWKEIAKRYSENSTVAGYNIMNEPVTGAPYGSYGYAYKPDWNALNSLNRETVKAIRSVDSHHIIFLEGDNFSTLFSGMEAPFDDNLVYSNHCYIRPGFVPGKYPGMIGGERWDGEKVRLAFVNHEGTKFADRHRVPLWVGEFGALLNGSGNDIASRMRCNDDQIRVFEEYGAHWTIWTYKDIGYMGTVMLSRSSPYMKMMKKIFRAKEAVSTDSWLGNVPPTKIKEKTDELCDRILAHIDSRVKCFEINPLLCRKNLEQTVLAVFAGRLLQPMWADAFRGKTKREIDRIMKSFSFEQCIVNKPLLGVIRKYTNPQL